MPENTPPINQTDLNTLNPSTPSPNIVAAAPKPLKPHRNLLPLVIILAILSCIGLGSSAFFGVQSFSKDSEISDLKSQLENSPNHPTKPGEDSQAPSTPSEPILDKAQILAEVPKSLVLSNKTALNSKHSAHFILSDSIQVARSTANEYIESPFSIVLNLNDQSTSITINWDSAKTLYPNLDGNTQSGSKTYTDLHLSGKATDMLLSGFGQAVGEETLFFLMEDGSIEYIPVNKALQENKIQSYGKLPDIANVIKFYHGGACTTSCSHSALAQRADGDYYDLYQAIHTTGNY